MIPASPFITKILLGIILLLSILLGFVLLGNNGNKFPTEIAKYKYLSPRILQEYHNDILINFLPLRNRLKEVTAPWQNSFGLYFEYLPSGTSIGINEKNEFPAASLFKVPVVMAYYHKKERLGQTNDPIVTIQEGQIDKEFGQLWKKGPGTQINLKDAVRLAITESDNTAVVVIGDQLTQEDFEPIYEGLDIDLQVTDKGSIITAKHFSSILKALYFSSVLSKEDSNEILNLMTKTKFNDMLPAGIQSNIPVAHKIGILKNQEYTDCGIVYEPKRPYLLCMISAGDEAEARERMKIVSNTIYEFVSTVNK